MIISFTKIKGGSNLAKRVWNVSKFVFRLRRSGSSVG